MIQTQMIFAGFCLIIFSAIPYPGPALLGSILRVDGSVKTQNREKHARINKPRNVWRGFSPLHATRREVEDSLGPPQTSMAAVDFYKFENEAVSFRYTKGNCDIGDLGWNVPAETILEIDVTPMKTILPGDLKVDLSTYERVESTHPANWFYYKSSKDGMFIQTRVLAGREEVISVKYEPSEADLALACPQNNLST